MHVHTKNDHDYDSAIHIQTSSFMIIPFSLNRDNEGCVDVELLYLKNIKLYWEILPCVRDLQLYHSIFSQFTSTLISPFVQPTHSLARGGPFSA